MQNGPNTGDIASCRGREQSSLEELGFLQQKRNNVKVTDNSSNELSRPTWLVCWSPSESDSSEFSSELSSRIAPFGFASSNKALASAASRCKEPVDLPRERTVSHRTTEVQSTHATLTCVAWQCPVLIPLPARSSCHVVVAVWSPLGGVETGLCRWALWNSCPAGWFCCCWCQKQHHC